VVSLPSDVFSYVAEKLAIRDAHICEKRDQIVWGVRSIGAAIAETSRWQRLGEQLLTTVWRVATPTLVRIAADVSVGMTDVVEVFGLEFLCSIVSVCLRISYTINPSTYHL
jgi:hypothetical protein